MLREPPHNLEAEQAVIGALLIDNDAYHRVSPFLLEEHFFPSEHGKLYAAAARLINAGRRATPITLKHEASDPKYLGQLAAAAVPPYMAEDMGKVIRDLASRRALIKIGEELAEQAYAALVDATVDGMIETAETSLAALAERGIQTRQVSLTEALIGAIQVVAAAYKGGTGLVGLSTGLADLDAKLGGLVPSELVVIAGRPSMGKSALAANIACHAAKNGTSIGFFTIEMSAQQITLRLLGENARVSSHRMRRGDFSSEEYNRIVTVAQELQPAPIRFDETGGISISQVCARARRWKRQHNIGLLVIDYLQLMSGLRRKDSGRVHEVSEITSGLKALAKELEVPVLALSQLSRQVESRDDKRPQLSDLRESGSIEQDADVVMFIYREEYYLARSTPKEENVEAHLAWQRAMRACAGRAEIIICKQRHGPSYGWPIRMFPSRSCDSCSTTLNNERALDRNPAEPHNATRLKRQMSEKLPKTARRRRSVTFINCNWPHCGCKRNSDASPYFHKRRREGRRLIEERCVSWKDLVTTFNALTPEPGNNDGLSKRRVGSLHLEFKKCGRASCRCRSGLPHGPYVYRHRREGGRQRKEYVPMRHLRDVVLDMERQRAQTARPAEIRRVLKGLRDV